MPVLPFRNLATRAVALAFSLAAALSPTSATGLESAMQTETVEETPTLMRANGTFEVKLGPLETYTQSAEAKIGRMSIDKTFAGDLVGTSGDPRRCRRL